MVTAKEQKRSMRSIAAYLVENIMQERGCSRDSAVEFLISTTVYEALMDADTDLYLESREFVLDILREELKGNLYKLLEV